jgi:stage II sporulation protein E
VECKVDFCKCGAAPTYVFRDGSLFKLRSRTVPIGIMDEVDVGRTEMELCPGDVIVMVSDGVTQGKEEYPELFEYVRTRIATHSAEQLADAIIDFAEAEDSADDVSVVVIKVEDTVGKR